MWILPEFIWTSPAMGSRRYRWLLEFSDARHRMCYPYSNRDFVVTAAGMLRSMSHERDAPADVLALSRAMDCGVQFPMSLACATALALPYAAHENYWLVVESILRNICSGAEIILFPVDVDPALSRMIGWINAADTPNTKFACAVELLEALLEDVARSSGRDEYASALRGVEPLTAAARARIATAGRPMRSGARLAVRDLGCVYKDRCAAEKAADDAAWLIRLDKAKAESRLKPGESV